MLVAHIFFEDGSKIGVILILISLGVHFITFLLVLTLLQGPTRVFTRRFLISDDFADEKYIQRKANLFFLIEHDIHDALCKLEQIR